jgi:hypothetical protein
LRRFAAKARPEFRRIEKESGWSVRDAFDGYVARMELAYFRPEDAPALAAAMAKTFGDIPENMLIECANEAARLRFSVAYCGLHPEGFTDPQLRRAICQKLGISTRTFYRRHYSELFRKLSVNADTHGKLTARALAG